MDFDLFMERYGYKILLGIIAAVIIIVVGVPIVGFVYALLKFSDAPTTLMILVTFTLIGYITFRAYGRVFDAYAKYWYKK